MKNPLHFAFFGTPEVAATVLTLLNEAGLVPAAIVTNPDRPRGRGMTLTASPVKTWAVEHGIPCLQPERDAIKSGALVTDLEAIAKAGNFSWDVFVVVAYGAILPDPLINLPRRGTVNLHFSLLPKHRGAAPVQAAIIADDKHTGITIMHIDAKMDHGPIIAQEVCDIADAASYPAWKGEWPPLSDLMHTLAQKGGALMVRTLPAWVEGGVKEVEQDHSQATSMRMIKKEDGLIDVAHIQPDADPALQYKAFRTIRAYSEWPGAYFFMKTNDAAPLRVKITAASWDAAQKQLIIENVIPDGRKEMKYQDFLKGVRQA